MNEHEAMTFISLIIIAGITSLMVIGINARARLIETEKRMKVYQKLIDAIEKIQKGNE